MDYLVTNIGILDLSFNSLNILGSNIENQKMYIYFGACIYANRLFFNCINNLCSINIDIPSDFKIEITNIDRGTHHILVKDNYIYIQETYYNRIKRFSISNDGIIDKSSCFLCPIYEDGINPNLLRDMANDHLYRFDREKTLLKNYRHINSLCFIEDLPNYLLCSSSFLRNGGLVNNKPVNIKTYSTIDYINLLDWSVESYPVPQYAIHDLVYYNGYIYYISDNSIHKFDPVNRQYVDTIFKYSDEKQTISRGLFFKDNFAYFSISNITSRNDNTNSPQDKNNSIFLKIDINSWTVVEEKNIDFIIYSHVK